MGTSSREYRERLIEEVRRCPVLYDTRHDHHRDNDVRDSCWQQIAARLGANSEVLKREWKILRDSLRQSLKKTRGGATTKAGAPCKQWRYHARMAFLLPHMTRRNPRRSSRDHDKPDLEDLEPEGRAAGGAREGGAREGEGETDETLELFFASVCASARRLPPPAQRALRRDVLDALLRAEDRASPRPRPDLSPRGPSPARYSSAHTKPELPREHDENF